MLRGVWQALNCFYIHEGYYIIQHQITQKMVSARRGPPTPKMGEDTFGTRIRPHAKFGVNWPAGCREIVDKKTNKTAKVKQIPRLLI